MAKTAKSPKPPKPIEDGASSVELAITPELLSAAASATDPRQDDSPPPSDLVSSTRPADGVPQPTTEPRSVMLDVPLLSRAGSYAPRAFRRDLPARHARVLREITDGLMYESAMLASGRLVKDHDDALCYLLEQLAGSNPNQ